MSASPSVRPGVRLPAPSWPVWLIFGLLVLPLLMTLGVLGVSKDSASEQLALQREAVGHSVVLTGTLTDVDTTSGLPKTTSYYTVVIPDAGGDSSATFSGGEQWGFPPSSEYPAELDFLVVLDDPPRAVSHGAVGSIQAVTEQTVREAEASASNAQALWVAGIVVFWLVAVGMPVLGIVLAVRRRRAKKRWRAAERAVTQAAGSAGGLPPTPRI